MHVGTAPTDVYAPTSTLHKIHRGPHILLLERNSRFESTLSPRLFIGTYRFDHSFGSARWDLHDAGYFNAYRRIRKNLNDTLTELSPKNLENDQNVGFFQHFAGTYLWGFSSH